MWSVKCTNALKNESNALINIQIYPRSGVGSHHLYHPKNVVGLHENRNHWPGMANLFGQRAACGLPLHCTGTVLEYNTRIAGHTAGFPLQRQEYTSPGPVWAPRGDHFEPQGHRWRSFRERTRKVACVATFYPSWRRNNGPVSCTPQDWRMPETSGDIANIPYSVFSILRIQLDWFILIFRACY